jgi:hypothetical protein
MAPARHQSLKYIGNTETDTLLISNHGNVSVTVQGHFRVSGLVYCTRYAVRLNMKGRGRISLRGVCKRLTVKITGDCLLDLSEMKIGELFCEAKGNATIISGTVKVICRAELQNEATLILLEETVIINTIKTGNSKIEHRPLVFND